MLDEPVTEPVRRLIAKYENRIERLEKANGRLCEQINSMPEIVRCRDCEYYDPNDEPSEVYPDRYWCDKLTVYMPTDGFCSFGKRKEGGE